MADVIQNDNEVKSLHFSQNIKIYMKLENTKKTHKLFENPIEETSFFIRIQNHIKEIFYYYLR